MALGKRKDVAQPLFISTADLPMAKANPFYDAVNKVLHAHHFEAFVEHLCAKFYCDNVGRPGLAPGIYFRCQFDQLLLKVAPDLDLVRTRRLRPVVDGGIESFPDQTFADPFDRPQAYAQRFDNLFIKAIVPVGPGAKCARAPIVAPPLFLR